MQRKWQVRKQRESNLVRGTYILEMAEGGTIQTMVGEQLSKGHLHPGDSRGRDNLGKERKQASKGHLLPGDSRGTS